MAKRLTRNRKGSIVLPSGETITKREQAAFRSAITSVNARRNRELARKPKAAEEYLLTGRNTDFTLKKRSGSFGQFQSKAQFTNALKMAKYISSGAASKERTGTYKENYIKGLYNMFDSAAYPLIQKISNLTDKEFQRAIDDEKLPDLGYLYYDPDNEKYNEIDTHLAQVIDDILHDRLL